VSRADSPLRERVIFNVGARRSGTLWLQRIVTAHPAVAAIPSESHLISHGIAPLFELFQHSVRSSPQVGSTYVDRDTLLDRTRDLCDAVFAEHLDPGARLIAERTPLHVLHLDLISELYPDARVIHIIRDGRDVARSIAAQDWGPETIAGAAREWGDSILSARRAGIPVERYREVRYERLAAAPEAEIPTLFEWLGLDLPAATLDQILAETRQRENVDPSSPTVGTGKWREAFTAAELDAFMENAGELLIDLGYEPEAAPGRPRRGPDGHRRGRLGRMGRRLRRAPAPSGASDLVVERLLASLRRPEDLVGRLAPDARVRIVTAAGDEQARGDAAHRLLRRALSDDPAFSGRQVRGDVFPAIPTVGVFLSYELDDGVHADRALFLTLEREQVTGVGLYAPPLGAPR
jgi:hypothetical protein